MKLLPISVRAAASVSIACRRSSSSSVRTLRGGSHLAVRKISPCSIRDLRPREFTLCLPLMTATSTHPTFVPTSLIVRELCRFFSGSDATQQEQEPENTDGCPESFSAFDLSKHECRERHTAQSQEDAQVSAAIGGTGRKA